MPVPAQQPVSVDCATPCLVAARCFTSFFFQPVWPGYSTALFFFSSSSSLLSVPSRAALHPPLFHSPRHFCSTYRLPLAAGTLSLPPLRISRTDNIVIHTVPNKDLKHLSILLPSVSDLSRAAEQLPTLRDNKAGSAVRREPTSRY